MINKEINFKRKDIVILVETINFLFNETGRLYNQYNNEPKLNSIAFKELSNQDFKEQVETAYSLGGLSMESAADHLIAFADLINEPLKTIAPWTCVRGLLESCSLACWFLDFKVDVKSRVGRSFAFRYKGFEEQLKLFRKLNDMTKIKQIENRIMKVETDAINLGFNKVLNKKNIRTGIAQQMPSITNLIEDILGKEFDYRLLSAVAHGHQWAIHQVGFKIIEIQDSNGKSKKALEKVGLPNFIIYVGMIAVTSFSQVLWNIWNINGWDKAELMDLLEKVYIKLNLSIKMRFWRMQVGSTSV